ncbi:efflux RND transporter periplasmic adaptor subunit [Saccharicrinis fermentans]|uniref:Cation efflux system protein CusB n=1 Tax=Saccharicrinis fermentans DSM 9555 = JCM 21142 TaxID=869213 RepID=W7YCR3_9BACT|nr:efflux RND transporter periplasmic adaptor subunit [Saccharicrinis fermentans]GAF05263.1 cation efflux system protein CusB precursor [Saccharicrinis fermentans DSM 9555 = JCM 21142]
MKTKIDIDKKSVRNYSIVLIIGLVLGWVFFHSSEKTTEASHNHVEQAEAATIWTCSMHPQIKQDKPGQCPICAMDLIPLETNTNNEVGIDPNEIQMSESAMKLAQIQTLIVKKEYSNKEVYLLGKVKPDERNISELTARFGGRIEKLYTNFTGQNVVKGEKLATIYSPELVTAQKELLESIEYKESNPSFYRASRNKLKLWDLTDAQIDGIETKGEPQNYFDVLSPISGTVTMRHVSVGDYIKEGNALFQVINLKKVWLMFDAYESDLPWLHEGNKVEFTVQSIPGETFTGKVTFIDPFLDAKTRVANVRVEVDNPKLELKPEMFANGIIKPKISGGKKDLMIPKTSVLWTGKRAVVYVKVPEREHNSFLYREITLGPEAGDFYIVKEGLSEGEEIAVNGVFKIDAASQLEGKPSMMNPSGGAGSTPHDMSKMGKNAEKQIDHSKMDMSQKAEPTSAETKANLEHAMFKVSGNCDLCKATIEKAVKGLEGINVADWNVETKQMHVSFNNDKVSLDKIHKTIAAAGYDTEMVKGNDNAYKNLPECCQYTRE